MFKWDVDLEAQGCTVSDVGHTAALLDDHRKEFTLEALSQDILGQGKVKGLEVDRMAEYPAWAVEAYAKQDINLVDLLLDKLEPLIREQDLGRVQQLEDDIIFPTCEMERNGAPLDLALLNQWCNESEQLTLRLLWEISDELGIKVEPTPAGLAKLFNHLDIYNPYLTDGGPKGDKPKKPSFKHEILQKFDHPIVQKACLIREHISLRNKFLTTYRTRVDPDGILRYALHQMRWDKGGTVSGRYSSSEMVKGDGVNIQQVAKPSKQKIREFIIRRLFVPLMGLWLSADAKQIEYRLFGHFSQAPKILAAYAENPETDFHRTVMLMVQRTKEINRDRTKDINFAKVYGAGLEKIAYMLGVSQDEARGFVAAYDTEFPEARALLMKASRIAKERGYVKTLLGRRAWFPRGEFLHAALNRVIQGSAADINKMKIIELHRERKHTGFKMRFTVHDEVDGDVPDQEAARRVAEILNRQSIELRVPILWDVKTGANWGAC